MTRFQIHPQKTWTGSRKERWASRIRGAGGDQVVAVEIPSGFPPPKKTAEGNHAIAVPTDSLLRG